MGEPVARPRPYPTVLAIMDLATAWTTVRLADAAALSGAEHRLLLAVKAIEVLGAWDGPCPSRVLIATRSIAKIWLESSPARKAGKLVLAVDAMVSLAMAYCTDEIDNPLVGGRS